MDSFSDAVSTIEGYHSTKEFNGSPDVFFALVEKCLLYRPVCYYVRKFMTQPHARTHTHRHAHTHTHTTHTHACQLT